MSAALGRAATLTRSGRPPPSRRAAAALRLAALGLLLLALAGPQWGVELVETRSESRQAVVAIDVSLSMITPDVRPTRLERAKAGLSLLIDQLRGERVGVVAFAGDAQVVCPLTLDVDAAKELLAALDVGVVPRPGSAVGAAIRTGAAMLGRYPGGKALVLLTDGEDHRSDPLGAAKEAAAAGVRVFTVGIGTPEGEPIPGPSGYHKDAKGVTVVSRLDEGTLAKVATQTGGAYYRSSAGGDEIADIVRRIKELDAAKGVGGKSSRWRDRYAGPASLAFLLLLAELLLPALARRPSAAGAAPTPARAAWTALLLLWPAQARAAERDLRAGNRLYGRESYEEALERYGRAASARPKDPRPLFNAGDALYRLDRTQDAAAAFEALSSRKDLPAARRAAALYNLGNARYRGGDYAGAAAAYRSALALAPRDAAARHNLAVALDRLKKPPQPQKKQDQKKDSPDKPQDKPQGGGGSGHDKNPPRTRPQDALNSDEAERVLRAVAEREKQTRQSVEQARGRRAEGGPPVGEDW